MSCPHCQGAEEVFGKGFAEGDLSRYYKKGPSKSTNILLNAIKQHPIEAPSLLDIGGGVGVIQHELVAAGVNKTTDVDASSAYLAVAQAEAERRGYAESATYLHGDFVDLVEQVEDADIVTLDRVLCCYPDVEKLISTSAGHAKRLYGLVYPHDAWWTRLVAPLLNLTFRFRGNPFRFFIHSRELVENTIVRQGFTQRLHRNAGFWQVVVYERAG